MKLISKFLNRETISYLICGVLTTIVGFGSFALADYTGMGTAAANAISNGLAILFAYVTNKIYVFRSPSWAPRFVAAEFAKFCGARLIIFALETLLLLLLVDVLGFNSLLMKGLAMVLVVLGNYGFSKWMVFTKK